MLKGILPAGVAVSEAFGDPAGAELYPEEARLITRAVEVRRREFTTVRHCARTALAELGLPAMAVLPDAHGAPRWPDSVVGSLTHCEGYRAAALAYRDDVLMIGIDAEPHGPLPEGVEEVVALPQERDRLSAERAERPALHMDRLLFSAKEAVYKAWYMYGGQRLDFEDADISFGHQGIEPGPDVRSAGTFTARPTRPGLWKVPAGVRGPAGFDSLPGRWLVRDGLVITAIAVPGARTPG
ncbi:MULTISPECIES: 4'-phosphopantetheinyl transferase [unclassified Streptomyces]|uniref:4'-phosphopantetheinyl transferase family protein n=1 Tax=unclassified Streptomyces TaxID=2593676 RepID=UPI00380A2B5D|nr:4'-phosphopantetheinyl transferase superfamily protein [Streptomyces sp. NBC_01014]